MIKSLRDNLHMILLVSIVVVLTSSQFVSAAALIFPKTGSINGVDTNATQSTSVALSAVDFPNAKVGLCNWHLCLCYGQRQ